jgi:putative transposase
MTTSTLDTRAIGCYGAGPSEYCQPAPRRTWNKLPDTVSHALIGLALKEPELSPRELAVSFVDQQQYFVSESSVYRLLKAHDLTTSPAFILMKASDTFAQPTASPISSGSKPTFLPAGHRLRLVLSVDRAQ